MIRFKHKSTLGMFPKDWVSAWRGNRIVGCLARIKGEWTLYSIHGVHLSADELEQFAGEIRSRNAKGGGE